MSPRDAAKFIGVSLKTFYAKAEHREFPSYKMSRKMLRCRKSDLMAYMERFRIPSAEEEKAEADRMLNAMSLRQSRRKSDAANRTVRKD